MQLFTDSANLDDIEAALAAGVQGITTNPSLAAKEQRADYVEHMGRVVALAGKAGSVSVSVEVLSDEPREMIRQARELAAALRYESLAVKVPVSHHQRSYLGVVRQLTGEGITVNCTACMAPLQAVAAAAAGARYVSVFYNRVRDGGQQDAFAGARAAAIKERVLDADDFDPNTVIKQARQLIADDYPQVKIIAGSIRSVVDMKQAGLAGAHIVTAAWQIIQASLWHFKTDEAVTKFLSDFSEWRTGAPASV
ncbi:hypothetical protein HYW67_00440 [Candidatus Parcubacteria bacterium]|nr:hypothetical protein [Candidatus Parcubacteria bacterium]